MSTEPRMDGTPIQTMAWRIAALREALQDIWRRAKIEEYAAQAAANALSVDNSNAKLTREAERDVGGSAHTLTVALTNLRAIAGHGDNTSYPSGVAARQVRAAIRDLLALFDAVPAEGRNIIQAATRVAAMDDDAVKLSAKHDPDIFRDVARAYLGSNAGAPKSVPSVEQSQARGASSKKPSPPQTC